MLQNNAIRYCIIMLKYDGRRWWHTQMTKISRCQPVHPTKIMRTDGGRKCVLDRDACIFYHNNDTLFCLIFSRQV